MQRFYRDNMSADELIYYRVVYKETDLYVATADDRRDECMDIITSLRTELEEYISRHKGFQSALAPISLYKDAPVIAVKMAEAVFRKNSAIRTSSSSKTEEIFISAQNTTAPSVSIPERTDSKASSGFISMRTVFLCPSARLLQSSVIPSASEKQTV